MKFLIVKQIILWLFRGSPFTPIFEEAVKYGKIGFLQVLEDVNRYHIYHFHIMLGFVNVQTLKI